MLPLSLTRYWYSEMELPITFKRPSTVNECLFRKSLYKHGIICSMFVRVFPKKGSFYGTRGNGIFWEEWK